MPRQRLMLTSGLLMGLFAAGYGVMFTMLDDFRDSYGISDAALGGVVAIGFFASFTAQVFFAPLADRGHARRLVVIGMCLNVGGLVTMAAGRSIVPLLAGRLVMGLGVGIAYPALRRIVILADPEHLGANIGRLLSCDVAGFAMGPALSAVLAGPFGIPAPFLVLAVATVACLPIILRVQVHEHRVERGMQARFAFDLLRMRPLLGALLLGAGVFVMVGTFDALWVLVLDDLHTADWIANVGIILFALPMVFLASRGGRMAQRVGPFRLGSVGLLIGAVFMASYGQWPSGGVMLAVAMVHSLSDGITVSSSAVAVAMVAPNERQAGAQGLLGGMQTLVGGVAALGASSLYGHQGRGVAYATCGVVMVLLVLASRLSVGPTFTERPATPEVTPDAPAAITTAP